MARLLAPVLCFTSEEVWTHLGKKGSIHLEAWPSAVSKRRDAALEQKWEKFLVIREKVLKALEERREKKEIGNSLEADVELTVSKKEETDFLKSFGQDLPGLFLVSRAEILFNPALTGDGFEVKVVKARGLKCERCWNYRDTVGKDKEHATLCHRCASVVKGV
jgi:isoleucyl-tRNA synthetase